jgi:hypothetical protein
MSQVKGLSAQVRAQEVQLRKMGIIMVQNSNTPGAPNPGGYQNHQVQNAVPPNQPQPPNQTIQLSNTLGFSAPNNAPNPQQTGNLRRVATVPMSPHVRPNPGHQGSPQQHTAHGVPMQHAQRQPYAFRMVNMPDGTVRPMQTYASAPTSPITTQPPVMSNSSGVGAMNPPPIKIE